MFETWRYRHGKSLNDGAVFNLLDSQSFQIEFLPPPAEMTRIDPE